MVSRDFIFVVPWNDDPQKSHTAVQALYPGHDHKLIQKSAFRSNSFLDQVRVLRQFHGKAAVFCFRSLDDINSPLLLAWIGLFHRCRETVLLDEAGNKKIYKRRNWLGLLPRTLLALVFDSATLLRSLVTLTAGLLWRRSPRELPGSQGQPGVAYLFPYPMLRSNVGGAMSHVCGFLSGLKQSEVECDVYTGRPLPEGLFKENIVPLRDKPFFFWEARATTYNWRFTRAVAAAAKRKRPSILYQRHGRFVTVGALLSRKLRVPLVLEYNGSEVWTARNWDPSRFRTWLRLCEEYSLRSAALIVVVSEPLRQELMGRGVPPQKILVNPNAVDPQGFRPNCGGAEVRAKLGFSPDDIVICFVGTFSYWHGIPVLQQAARRLLEMVETDESLRRLRFLLIGDGLLRAEAAAKLQRWVASGLIIFTGSVPHQRIPALLDAADILLSPHIPFSDGSEFFGSPTKLFEYMAMAKAVVASNLGQIGQILEHGRTGWLVTPGSVDELVAAVLHLVRRPELRATLGANGRETVLGRYTWRHNAEAVLNAARVSLNVQVTQSGGHNSTSENCSTRAAASDHQ